MANKARIVNAVITSAGKVTKIDDPSFHITIPAGKKPIQINNAWRPDANLDAACEEEHYGWTLKPDIDAGCEISFVLPTAIDVCTNDKDNPKHMNTVRALPPEVVKLDCGYWGNYYREKPQRNFGVVQGYDVWLCNFKNAPFNNTSDLPDPKSPFGRLLDSIKDRGLGVELVSHTVSLSNPVTSGLDDNLLYIFLPDLHLPERWPDFPDASLRHPDPSARAALRLELRKAQHEPGWLEPNPMDDSRQDDIQEYLEDIFLGGKDPFAVPNPKGGKYSFTPAQVSAEKDVLDRTIRSRSTWFYPPATGNSETSPHQTKDDIANGDPAPAIDLAMFLAAIKLTRADGATIKIVQLGDLYELWMGREFLYRDFPSLSIWGLGATGLLILQTIASDTSLGVNDGLQYRMGVDWSDGIKDTAKSWLGIGGTHPVPRYVFHSWFKGYLIHRYQTGWHYQNGTKTDYAALKDDGVKDNLARLCKLLSERVRNVERFCLPIPPDTSGSLISTLTEILDDSGHPLSSFAGHGADTGTYRWNRMIFDLLLDNDFENIHGNHDGYRSDPLFRTAVGLFSEEWKSFDGIWAEHGHRWDEYNRDGVAFGAGMTNLVYYYNQELIEMSKSSLVAQVFPQEQKSFIPGAAQWYILVNIANKTYFSRDNSKKVKPFGIYVAGHTHSPDLCRIQFQIG